MTGDTYAIPRIENLRKEIARKKRKLAAFKKTGEPAWLSDYDGRRNFELSIHLELAERDFLVKWVAANPDPPPPKLSRLLTMQRLQGLYPQ